MTKVLALDIGDKRIGVASGDASIKIAHPHCLLKRAQGEAEAKLVEMIKELKVQTIVVGLPLLKDGQLSEQAHKIQNFCRRLQKRINISLEYIDEFGSSEDAKEALSHKSNSHARANIDVAAACENLTRYFSNK